MAIIFSKRILNGCWAARGEVFGRPYTVDKNSSRDDKSILEWMNATIKELKCKTLPSQSNWPKRELCNDCRVTKYKLHGEFEKALSGKQDIAVPPEPELTFKDGVVMYGKIKVKVMRGYTYKVFEQLHSNIGEVVSYAKLNNGGGNSPDPTLKNAKLRLTKSIKEAGIPFEIDYQEGGYILTKK